MPMTSPPPAGLVFNHDSYTTDEQFIAKLIRIRDLEGCPDTDEELTKLSREEMIDICNMYPST